MIFAGNWKLNKTQKETKIFFNQFLQSDTLKKSLKNNNQVIFFPQALLADCVCKNINNFFLENKNLDIKTLSWGLQNIFYNNQGAFTGENSAESMKSMGGAFCLVGHSERRNLFKETNQEVFKKLQILNNLNIKSILCFGESLDLRQSGEYKNFILKQLKESLATVSDFTNIILAYEPVWAIGTGKQAATIDIIEISDLIKQKYPKLKLLYGGSVTASNAKDILNQKNIDGVLVGGASLEANSFLKILDLSN